MQMLIDTHRATWSIAALATSGVIIRPWHLPEAVWAVLGAAALVGLGLLPWTVAAHAIGKGTDVYLFLTGMMLLAELARREGLFDWLAALAAGRANGSARRLFGLIYGVGTVVTVFLSNDATAVVLTPAVYAVTKAARVEPLPYLFVCAFIANAASFVLPISNPANLVIFGSSMPPLTVWLSQFALPSMLSIVATYAVLRLTQAPFLRQSVATDIEVPALSRGGRMTAYGISGTALALLIASARDTQLGFPTCLAGCITAAIVLLHKRESPWPVVKGVSWSVLPLVAGLFVLVEGLEQTGILRSLSAVLNSAAEHSAAGAAWGAGIMLALGCNVMNNLPAGLIAGATVRSAHASSQVIGAVLIGVDLGPNLSVTGSLATILWLAALRREGQAVSSGEFLRLGFVVMLPALLLALGGLVLSG
ncbi:MAG: arsenic transporter [Deltaproteobacteria bacterium]|nr:arsenic transporter [Deltaproteobacteria bacterium]